jgi:hypothetical protein
MFVLLTPVESERQEETARALVDGRRTGAGRALRAEFAALAAE